METIVKKLSKLTTSIRSACLVGLIGSVNVYAAQEQEIEKTAVDQVELQEVVEDEDDVERIEVTGSRIKQIDFEGPSPVTVISAAELQAKGFATAFDALKDLTSNTGTTQGAESAATGGFTPNAQTVSLRGLGNNQVLILVNGRRMADYPSPYNGQGNFVNLSAIPAVAIARIEVLTAGASAIYGSDAVAGVMNIITKKDVEDTTVAIKGGVTTEGGGEEGRFQIVSGISDNNYSLTGALEYQVQKKILAADRDWMDSVEDGPAGHTYLDRGIVVVDELARYEGFYRNDEEYFDDEDEFLRPPRYISPANSACQNSGTGYIPTDRIDNEGEENEYNWGDYCGTDNTGTRTIRNDRETVSAYLSGIYDLTDDVSVFADVLYSYQEAEYRSGFHYFNEEMMINVSEDGTGENDSNLLPLENDGFAGTGVEDWKWVTHQRFFSEDEIGFKDGNVEDSSLMVNVGLKGVVFDEYDWEVTFSRSDNQSDSYSTQLKEEQVKKYFLGTQHDISFGDAVFRGYDGVNTIGLYDPLSEQVRADLAGTQWQASESYSNAITAVVSGVAWEMDHGDAMFAAVLEWNEQGYDMMLDDRTLAKEDENGYREGWYNLTGSIGGGDRSRYAVGLELQIPVTEQILASLAGRYDEYEDGTTDIGGRFTPQVGISYTPIDEVLLRGTWSTSFKAPDMHRVFAEDGGYYTTGVDIVGCEIAYYEGLKDEDGEFTDLDPVNDKFDLDNAQCAGQSIRGNTAGSKTLKEEEGTSYGLGIVWEATEDLNITLDWYKIEIEQLVVSESLQGVLVNEFYCQDRSDEELYPDFADQNDRPDIEPGSAFCQNNDDKITDDVEDWSDVGPFGREISSVFTSHENAAKQMVEGIDAKVNYKLETSYGDFRLDLAWTHTLDSSYQATEDGEEVHTRDKWWNSTARSVINGSLTWMQADYSLTLSGRRIGSTPIMNPPQEFGDENSYYYQKVQRVDPYYTFNLTGGWAVYNDLFVSAQIVNLFNPRPPKDQTAYSWPYFNSGAYGGAAVGRTVSAELSYRF